MTTNSSFLVCMHACYITVSFQNSVYLGDVHCEHTTIYCTTYKLSTSFFWNSDDNNSHQWNYLSYLIKYAGSK